MDKELAGKTSQATQNSVHWTLGILRHFQAFFWLRVFSASKHCPHPPTSK
jgi:hypothetical protein